MIQPRNRKVTFHNSINNSCLNWFCGVNNQEPGKRGIATIILSGMKVKFRIILVVMFSAFPGWNIWAQGFWDIKYQPIDSADESLVGRAVRLDFKSKSSDRMIGKVSLRRTLAKRDTVSLMIDSESRCFVENWRIYVDHGVLADQMLDTVDKGKKIVIKEMFIRALNRSSITLQVFVYSPGETNRGVEREIIVDKAIVQGILSSL